MGIWVKQPEKDWVTSETRTALTGVSGSVFDGLTGPAHAVLVCDKQVWLEGVSQHPLHPKNECSHCSAQAAGDLPTTRLSDQVPNGAQKSLFVLLSVYFLRTGAR